MADPARRVLVVGGTGVFGRRLVAGLLATTAFDVVVAGRDVGRLAALVGQHGPRLTPSVLDLRHVTAVDLRATGALVVVDAAGRTAESAIAAGLHYVDLADARDFVAGFATLDAAARTAGVVALTGASSTPALSNAVLDELTAGWQRIDRVEIVISPGNRAPRGLAVMRSILSYAGRPVRVFTGGRWQARPVWGLTTRRILPGLGRRFLSLAETPDLDIVPARFAVRQAAVFRAGLELSVLHLGLLAASIPVRLGLLRSLVPLVRPFRTLAGGFERLGTDRGGMVVQVSGWDGAGQPVRATWSLVAKAGDGPSIPTLPALAALRALAEGRIAPGTSACVGVLPLAAIEAEFRPYRISTRIRRDPAPAPLYERVLGAAFDTLPLPVQRLHRPGWGLLARGMAVVEGADRLPARLVARALQFSPAGEMPVQVAITPAGPGERWVRDFGGHRFASTHSPATQPGRVRECFGPFTFELDLPVGPAGVLGTLVRRWWLGPLRLPLALAPVSVATETVDAAGRFRFDLAMHLPFGLGRLVRYTGRLVAMAAALVCEPAAWADAPLPPPADLVVYAPHGSCTARAEVGPDRVVVTAPCQPGASRAGMAGCWWRTTAARSGWVMRVATCWTRANECRTRRECASSSETGGITSSAWATCIPICPWYPRTVSHWALFRSSARDGRHWTVETVDGRHLSFQP